MTNAESSEMQSSEATLGESRGTHHKLYMTWVTCFICFNGFLILNQFYFIQYICLF